MKMSDIYETAIHHSHISMTGYSTDACLLLKLKVPDFMSVWKPVSSPEIKKKCDVCFWHL